MKIGVDASRLTRKDMTGIERHLYELLRSLSEFDSGNEYILYSPQELNLDFVKNNNITCKVLKKHLSWTQLSLSVELFKNPVDVLLCTSHTIPIIYPFWRTRIVSVIHDLTGNFFFTFLSVRLSAKVVAVSNYIGEQLKNKFGVNSRNLSVIHEGHTSGFQRQDLEKVNEIKAKYNIVGDYMLFVGTIGKRKNIKRMLEAYENSGASKKGIKFVLVGKMSEGYDKAFENSPEGVMYLGRVGDLELQSLYSGAMFLVYASEEEGFGIPILEAFHMEVPVLTSNITATKEVAGDAALLVDPFSVDSISHGMKTMLEDEKLRKEFIEKGKSRLEKFSWNESAKQFKNLFEELKNA